MGDYLKKLAKSLPVPNPLQILKKFNAKSILIIRGGIKNKEHNYAIKSLHRIKN